MSAKSLKKDKKFPKCLYKVKAYHVKRKTKYCASLKITYQ